MNNFPYITLIGWETRNWRHQKQALVWCRDYGLKPVIKHIHVGELYGRERSEMESKMRGLFAGKTEKFFIATFCKSCYTSGMKGMPHKKDIGQHLAFELVQMPKKA